MIKRLQAVHLVVDDINSKAKQVSWSDYEPSFDVFDEPIENLLMHYGKEYDKYRLDEIVVAAITPIVSYDVSVQHNMHLRASFSSKGSCNLGNRCKTRQPIPQNYYAGKLR